ncbi:MAG: glutamate racemase [Candidatus Saccharibacteria bacterium]
MKIGVFDSGMGGKSVANAIQKALPADEVIYVSDDKNVPYGSKTSDEIYKLVLPILKDLAIKVDVIVVACNTVSTTLINPLREAIKTPLIAMEPMVKSAAEQTDSGIIAVCATPTTLASKRYQWLKDSYAEGVTVLQPDCSDWSQMIESDTVNRQHVQERIEAVCQAGADVIVLGCTHYHWIEAMITEIADDRAKVLQPEQAVIRQLKRVIKEIEQPA